MEFKKLDNRSMFFSAVAFFVVLLVFLFIYIVSRINTEAQENAYNAAMLVSKDVNHTIELYFRDGYTVGNTLAGNILDCRKNKIPRNHVYSMIKESVRQHNNFLAIWTMWEPNAYDHADHLFAGDSIHDQRGDFAIAYYYDQDSLKCEVNDTLDYHEDFYLTPKRVGRPIIVEPFNYQYHGNPRTYYQTCIISPVMDQHNFIGVVGIDLDLEALQKRIDQIKVSKTGMVSILSNDGQIVTSPEISDHKLSRKFSRFLHDSSIVKNLRKNMFFVSKGQSASSGEKVYRYFYPINLEYMASPWYVMVEIPESDIMHFTNKIKVISLAVLLAIFLIVWLILNNIRSRRKQESYNRVLFQDSRMPLIVMDPETLKFVDCNFAAIKAYGFDSKQQLIGKTPVDVSFTDLSQEDLQLEVRKRILVALRNGSVFFEWDHVRENGEIWNAQVHLMTFEFSGKKLLQFSLWDITERKRIQRELINYKDHLEELVKERTEKITILNKELQQTNEELFFTNEILFKQKEELALTLQKLRETHDQLVHSEKMATIGIMTLGVAHEINNPLNFIQGGYYFLSDVAEDMKKCPEMNPQSLEAIQNGLSNIDLGIKRISAIVESLGRFGRQGIQKNLCNLVEIIDNCLVILKSSYQHKCTMQKLYKDQEVLVYCNEGKMHQILLNILHNAVQSIEKNGNISMDIITNVKTREVEIIITDNGKGISEENLNRIFVPFFTTKGPGEGTGLGLYIVYNLVQEHHGKIEYHSKVGEGTQVNICLPMDKPIAV